MKTRDPMDRLLKQAVYGLGKTGHSDTECPEEGVLADYLQGRLAPEQEQGLEGHMVDCSRCRKTVIAATNFEQMPSGAGYPGANNNLDGPGVEEDDATEMSDFEEELGRLEEELGIGKEEPDQESMPCIMVVDDDLSYLHSLTEILSQDYSVVACSSGQEALGNVSERISAIVLDIKMPGMDGLEVARRLKQTRHDIALIFNTGYPGEYARERIQREYDPCEYVTKDNPALLESFLNQVTDQTPSLNS